ncbi:unnamed protein product [Haemonchus placei]|uniref:Protein kinase domain-containing protein n=1 Tax=Haemonchus placei TaxID=6290 RepID=A0A0N4X6D7_HAEPC|nr:unnamed protein product [Haemonchus placei]
MLSNRFMTYVPPEFDCFLLYERKGRGTLFQIGFLHRDLKPGNLAVGPIGTPQFRLIHIFDFGLARQYVITSGGERPKLRRPRPRVHFRGTLRYCSINCQQKGEQGRDDDLWCFLYMLAELRGPLPWASIRQVPHFPTLHCPKKC